MVTDPSSLRVPSALQLRAQTARELGPPAIALIVYFGITCGLVLLGIAYSLVEDSTEPQRIVGMVPILAAQGVGLAGAIAMHRVKSYAFAVTSVVIALLPCCGPLSLFGMAFGVWAAVLLFKGTAPYAFRSEAAPAEVVARVNRGGRAGVVVAIVIGISIAAVAGLGVMSALAIYGVRRYVFTAKTAEARSVLGRVTKDMAACYQERGALPPSSDPVPLDIIMVRGAKYQSSPAEWETQEAFACARFSLSEPQYYQYQWVLNPDGVSGYVVARGDLDGDGQLSEYQLHLECDDGGCRVAPQLVEQAPLE